MKRLGSVFLNSLADLLVVGAEFDGEYISCVSICSSDVCAYVLAFRQLFRFSRKQLGSVYLASLADWPVVGSEFDGESIDGKRIGQSPVLANIDRMSVV